MEEVNSLNFLSQWDWRGSAIVYFLTLFLKSVLKKYIPKKYHDPVILGIAVSVAIAYGVCVNSFLSGLMALSGAQLINALIKKGIFFKTHQ